MSERPLPPRPYPRLTATLAAVAVVTMAALTASMTISGSTSEFAGLAAAVHVLMVVVPIGVGVFVLHRPPFSHFGALLIVCGPLMFLAMLSNSEDATLYSIGRISGWWIHPFVVYLTLSFPTGLLRARVDRRLMNATLLLLLLMYLPTVPFIETFMVPTPWTTCDAECPENAFMLAGSQPELIEDVVRPLREFLLVALYAAVALRIAQRVRDQGRPARRALVPVLAMAGLNFSVYIAVLVSRRVA